MQMFRRFFYFILTNILVVATIGILLSLISYFFHINFYGGGAGMLVLCSVWGFGGAFVSLLLSKFMAKRVYGIELISPETMNPNERKLLMRVHDLARRANLPGLPEVGIYESPEPNAFATGASRGSSLVAVSTGLLQTMTEDELEGVLGHEIAHIANGDMITLTLIQGVVNSFAMFISFLVTQAIMNALRRNDDDSRGGGMGDFFFRHMIYNLVSIVFTLLGSIVVMAFSRAREFRADAGGAQFASREKMTAALQKLQRLSERTQLAQDNFAPAARGDDNFATFKISGKTDGWARFFMTHPPLEERILALQNRTYLQT